MNRSNGINTKVDLTQMSKFSPEHQCGIVKMLIEDKEFREKAIDLIDVNSFTADEAIRTIAAIVKEQHSKDIIPDYDTIRIYISSKISEMIRREKCLAYLDQYMENSTLSPASIQYLKDNVYPLIEYQELRRLVGELTELINKNKTNAKYTKDDVIAIMEDYDKRTSFNDCSYEVLDSSIDAVKRLLQQDTYEYIPTSSKLINVALGGGLRKGDVGLFLAGSGVAKTCMTTSFVCYNARRGKKVAHFVLEDKKDDILKKYVAFITNIPVSEFPKRQDEVEKRISEYQNDYNTMMSNIRGVFATKDNGKIKVMSTKDIDKELERMVNDGFVPDMVVVDYYDRIRKNGKEIWIEDQIIINDMLEIATKYNVALWMPTQGTKAAQNPNTELDASSGTGGAFKTYGVQTYIAVQKQSLGVFKLSILKSRHYPGENGFIFEFDNGTCRFVNDEIRVKQLNESVECIKEMFDTYAAQKAKETKNKLNK